MNAVSFDTLAIARKLKAAGFSEDQAEAVTGVLQAARQIDLSDLVTKTDLKAELSEAKYDIVKRVLSAIGFQAIVIVGAMVALSKGVH